MFHALVGYVFKKFMRRWRMECFPSVSETTQAHSRAKTHDIAIASFIRTFPYPPAAWFWLEQDLDGTQKHAKLDGRANHPVDQILARFG